MQKPLVHHSDVIAALALLTRLPLKADFSRGARAAWAWPLAGLVVGGASALVACLSLAFGLSPAVSAALALTVQPILTGALHEDGLADSADGLWGGHDKMRRLEIMKDSAIGSYGVIALILSLVLRWALITSLLAADHTPLWLIAPALLSRAPMVVLAAALPNARGKGLSHSVGRPPQNAALLAVTLALLLSWLVTAALPLTVFLTAILTVSLTTIAVAAIAKRKIGGQTGDILGATQQLCESAALLALAA
ncbi:MAG: adenosylcobinamide-GDP ribazoletransferase [Maritimibacter sp.]